MSRDSFSSHNRKRKPKSRKFFKMGPDVRSRRRAGYRLKNRMTLTQGRSDLGPPIGRRGFRDYPEPPRLVFDHKLGRVPRDLEQCSAYWLISDRMKTVLKSVDPQGFAFVRCEVHLRDGRPGPRYWLCDVVRILDAIDETASRLRIYDEKGDKTYNLMGGANLVFKQDIVARAHVFRMAHLEPSVICDQDLKDACKSAGLKGISFRDAANL
jgi:hypothetical protein